MKYTIGVDEAGRGPIAGPVSVAVFYFKIPNGNTLISRVSSLYALPLRDSKKLTTYQKEQWFSQMKIWKQKKLCDYSVSLVHAHVIDRIGIIRAIQLALSRCLQKVPIRPEQVRILLDGSLYAPKYFLRQKTIIKGDEKIPVISLASIVAKVHRDRYMHMVAKKLPQYGFEHHVGYGTKAHYGAIKHHGLSSFHRKTFLKDIL